LCIFFFEEDGNDHHYVYKKLKKKPSDDELLKILKEKGMEFVNKENLSVTISKPFEFSSYWKKEHKNAFSIEHKDKKIFNNEKDFLKNCDDNASIFYYLNKDPHKYYRIIKPKTQKPDDKNISIAFLKKKIKSSSQEAQFIIRLFTEYWENNPKEKNQDYIHFNIFIHWN
jgi:preprotein translocase subunit Sss1